MPKIRKLLPLMGSPNDGEALGAVRAAGRTLAAAGLDFHDLARALTERPEPARLAASAYRGGIDDIVGMLLAATGLTPWESEFVASIANRLSAGRRLSPAQHERVIQIYSERCR